MTWAIGANILIYWCFHRYSLYFYFSNTQGGGNVMFVWEMADNYFKKLTNVINEELENLIFKLLMFSGREKPKVKYDVCFLPHFTDAVVIHKVASMNCESTTRCMNWGHSSIQILPQAAFFSSCQKTFET